MDISNFSTVLPTSQNNAFQAEKCHNFICSLPSEYLFAWPFQGYCIFSAFKKCYNLDIQKEPKSSWTKQRNLSFCRDCIPALHHSGKLFTYSYSLTGCTETIKRSLSCILRIVVLLIVTCAFILQSPFSTTGVSVLGSLNVLWTAASL